MEIYDVVRKLIGPIEPIGETNTDNKRFENLQATIELVEKLLSDIEQVASNSIRQEFSMKRAGQEAALFLAEVRSA